MVGKLEALAALSKALVYRAESDSDMTRAVGAIGVSVGEERVFGGQPVTSKLVHELARG